jgi:hypothetical protein
LRLHHNHHNHRYNYNRGHDPEEQEQEQEEEDEEKKYKKKVDYMKFKRSLKVKKDYIDVILKFQCPQKIQWKIINPGEQATSTFHQLILKDLNIWYNGKFYNNK